MTPDIKSTVELARLVVASLHHRVDINFKGASRGPVSDAELLARALLALHADNERLTARLAIETTALESLCTVPRVDEINRCECWWLHDPKIEHSGFCPARSAT